MSKQITEEQRHTIDWILEQGFSNAKIGRVISIDRSTISELIFSITVQEKAGATTNSTTSETLQMETTVLPTDDASSVTGTALITTSNQAASVNNRSASDFVIYPNPVHSQIYIESEKKIKTLTILNVLGEI